MTNPSGEDRSDSGSDSGAPEVTAAAEDSTVENTEAAPSVEVASERTDEAEPSAEASADDSSAAEPTADGSETAAIDVRDAHSAAPSDDPVTEVIRRPHTPPPVDEPATEIFAKAAPPEPDPEPERRFTAPSGFDGSTQIIEPAQEPATEVFATTAPPPTPAQPAKTAVPQSIPPRGDAPKPPRKQRSWGWVIALILVIAALVAVAILGTILLTRDTTPVVSEEERVTDAIMNYDAAIKKGDLAMLRTITCGATRETYVNFDDRAWAEVHGRVAAAEEYPVIASVDQVVINGDHAEANVTTFMAKASDVRSTRSIDLQFRDDQWKVCQDAEG